MTVEFRFLQSPNYALRRRHETVTCELRIAPFPDFFFPFFLFFKIFPSRVLTCRTNSRPLLRLPVYIPTQLRLQKRPEAEKSWGRPYFPHTSQHSIWVGSNESFSFDLRLFLTLSTIGNENYKMINQFGKKKSFSTNQPSKSCHPNVLLQCRKLTSRVFTWMSQNAD